MGPHVHHARRQLRRDCEDLVGWTVALRAAQPDGVRFLDAWVPLASGLRWRAYALDRRTGGEGATRAVEDACDAVLAGIGFAPLPGEAYGGPAIARRTRPRTRCMAA